MGRNFIYKEFVLVGVAVFLGFLGGEVIRSGTGRSSGLVVLGLGWEVFLAGGFFFFKMVYKGRGR